MELYESLFEEQFMEAHNAAADVEATARCFFELLARKIISPETLKLTTGAIQSVYIPRTRER